MKKVLCASAFIAISIFTIFVSCSSISVHPSAYVVRTEHFVASEIVHNQLARTISWQNYELRLERVRNQVSQEAVNGNGKRSGTLFQRGDFYKNGEKLFSTNIYNEFDGTVYEDVHSKSALYDESYRIESGVDKLVFELNTMGNESLLSDDKILPLVFTEISESINEHGKIYKMWFNNTMGVSVEIDDELYAIVDYEYNPARIRENPDFSKLLTEEQKDMLVSLMLEVFNYRTSFRQSEK